jgi:surfeit locus 1 family protein
VALFIRLFILVGQLKKSQWILAACIFLTLVGLGSWQVYRLQWKQNLIDAQQHILNQPPVDTHQILHNPAAYTWRQVITEGEWESTTYFVIGRTHAGKAGYHAVQAMRLKKNGHKVLVNRGWTPHKNVASATGKACIHGIVRPIEPVCWWHPTHRPVQCELGHVDPVIVAADTRFYIAQTDTHLAPVGMPVLNNPHLGYAVTWFLLAIIWLNMAGWYWWKHGRFVKVKKRRG